ncbi:hypothetical protein [Parachitinimonas caeni]|uniref:Uncharacterized protein n=1 Tax=Parachitinimonas caeni TaxID=3031301 RepID=A0ABT7DSS7_9NEIS|nr:hypothetical protein [Parachitinimonas caeni]MDK2123124.1 hypothetical protein [Parachitinimonas caeni]
MKVDLDLPGFDADAPLEFVDARGFKEWLKLVPMINVRQAHTEILDTLARLNRAPVPPVERIKMLEMLREPLSLLQEENTKRYAGKPFPLAEAEAAVWHSNVTLWREMSIGYRHCWRAALDGESGISDYVALAGQRSIRYTALAIREHHLAYRVVSELAWSELFALFRLAENNEHSVKIVKDSQNRQTELSSCAAAFSQALLLAAANPSAMSIKQILWVDRLLDRWSNQTPLLVNPPQDCDKGMLTLQLDQPGEAKRLDPPPRGETFRYIDTDSLARSIRKRIKYLRAGESPAQLGLGEEYSATASESYLISLYQEWCDMPVDRALPRHTAEGIAEITTTMEQSYTFIGGAPFDLPERPSEIHGRAITDFQLFGNVAQHVSAKAEVAAQHVETERWDIINQSALGFRLSRTSPGQRVAHHQLLAIRPAPGQPIVLGTIRWIKQGENDALEAGIRILPGIPKTIAVRATGLNTFSNKFTPALMLPPVTALQTQPSLVLPLHWFKAGRILEVYQDGQIRRMRLDGLLERGLDFERISFSGALH